MLAELKVENIITDGSSVSADITGVLAYYCVYKIILEAADSSGLPNGDYVLSLWQNRNLLATTEYDFYDSSLVGPPPDSSQIYDSSNVDSSQAKSLTSIQIVNGVGYGILDLREPVIYNLITTQEQVDVKLLLYDWRHRYLLVRQSVPLYRNEAGINIS